jgi:DNA polymerase I
VEKILVLDVETSTFNKGSPHSKCNRLEYVGLYDGNTYDLIPIEYGGEPFKDRLDYIQRKIDEAAVVIGHNIKFDILWLNRYNINVNTPLWDTSVFFFLSNAQRTPFPSLSDVSNKYGVLCKGDLASDFWNKGIDTKDIPKETLESYLQNDLEITYQVYKKQVEDKEGHFGQLFWLQMEDLHTLIEMEREGLKYFDKDEADRKATELEFELQKNTTTLQALCGGSVPINWDSPDQVRIVLFGGTLKVPGYSDVEVTLKNGTTKTKRKQIETEVVFKPLFSTTNVSTTDTGKYSVDEETLYTLPARNSVCVQIKSLLRARRRASKMVSTYYRGFSRSQVYKQWEHLHPSYNQTLVVTGRLSSSGPNAQNIPKEIRSLFKANPPKGENNNGTP